MDTDKTLCWERRIQVLENENKALHKELAIKNVISEISRFQGKDDKISLIYKKIFSLISEIIHIDNFYICVINDGLIDIPFAVDQFDKLTSDIRNEKSNPELRNSLTAYAIKKGKSLALNEEEIIKLEKKGKFKLLGKMPKQWIFLPFHTGNLDGGIVAQSYKKNEDYTYSDMSMLAYVTMHVGNFLSAYNSKEKIKQQYEELKATQGQLVHSEKMASIGQLAAGVAHEINNPLGYINSNLNSLRSYVKDIGAFIGDLIKISEISRSVDEFPSVLDELKKKHDVDFILSDIVELVSESIFGMEKVKSIIQSLKNFTHAGEEKKKKTNINNCIDETIRIVWNELKYHCEVVKDYGEIPKTYCYPSQLNQVFMNLLINASHAIKENGVITVKTSCKNETIFVEIKDNGEGIDEEHISQLFNPFFTTKPVGQGTGLGLSISYGIVENHKGTISVSSDIGVGTCFKISLPVVRKLDETIKHELNGQPAG